MRAGWKHVGSIVYPPTLTAELEVVLPRLPTDARPTLPSGRIPEAFLDEAFLASLNREEGRPLRFQVALLDPAVSSKRLGPAPWWSETRFENPRPYRASELAKAALATDFRQTVLAAWIINGALRLWGLVRTGTSVHNLARAESRQGINANVPYLRASFEKPGTFEVGTSRYLLARIESGRMVSMGTPLLVGGVVASRIASIWADSTPSSLERALEALRRILFRVIDAGHGGIIVLQPGTGLAHYHSTKYRVKARSGHDLYARISKCASIDRRLLEVSRALHTSQNLSVALDLIALQQARPEAEANLTDAIDQCAKMTQVDGALVLGEAFAVLGFGAIALPNRSPRAINRSIDVFGETRLDHQETERGTRHLAARAIASRNPRCVVFCISQDGDCSAFASLDGHLVCWSPVELESYQEAPDNLPSDWPEAKAARKRDPKRRRNRRASRSKT